MTTLSNRELELVALAAAMGSNCVSCVECHIPAARRAGLTDPEIRVAIGHADKIRQVPARKTLQAALGMLPATAGTLNNVGLAGGGSCGPTNDAGSTGPKSAEQPADAMTVMMAKMMDACDSPGRPAGASASAATRATASSRTDPGCRCG